MNEITPQWMIDQGFSVDFAERFWAKVFRTPSCWFWTAALIRGYGRIKPCGTRLNQTPIQANRASWMLRNGPIPDGMEVLHDCPIEDVRSCVRPEHLKLGTKAENVFDTFRKTGGIRGESHHLHKLSESQVAEILELCSSGRTHRALGQMFGVSHTAIGLIIRGVNWSHLRR